MLSAMMQAIQRFFSTLQQAVKNNDQIKAARSNLKSAKERIVQNRASLLPNLSFAFSSTLNHDRWDGGEDSSDPESMSLSLSIPILNQKSWRTYQQAFPYVAAAELDLEATIQEKSLQVISEIIAVLQAQKVADLSKTNVEVTKQHMEATQYRHSVGELTVTEQSRAVSRHATAYANWIEAQNQASIAHARLEEVAGEVLVGNPLSVPDPKQEVFQSSIETILPLLENRFDVLAAKYRLEEAEKKEDAQQAGHYPTISINTDAERTWDQESSSKPGTNDSLAVGFELKLPLYSGGSTVSKTNQPSLRKTPNRQALMKSARKQLEKLNK